MACLADWTQLEVWSDVMLNESTVDADIALLVMWPRETHRSRRR